MAEAMDSISCPICIDPLKNPVTLPCGHSYCMGCIEYHWDQEDQKGLFSCPICQESFMPRPALKKNTVLEDLVGKIEKMEFESASISDCYSGSEDMHCDVCSERKQKALMSCLVCMVSYCEAHLQPHYECPAFKKHKLVKASANLQEKICSRHNKLLEVFCRTDQKCICCLCFMGEHKNHDTVSAVREMKEKLMELCLSQQKLQQKIQERNKEHEELQQAVMSFNHSAQEAETNSDRIFDELIRSIETRRSEVKELIRAQQRGAVSQAEGLLECLEHEIAKLKTREAELEKLSLTDDPLLFLQRYEFLSSLSSDLPIIRVPPPLYFGDVTEALSELTEKLEGLLKGEWLHIPAKVSLVDVVLPLEPKSRDDFLKYSCSLTLDPNTANKHIRLSNWNRKAKCVWPEPYPNHPERFYKCLQVLCKEDVSARCYWEVKWSSLGVYIALSYKDIGGTGWHDTCGFGSNEKSWCLQCYNGGYSFKYNNVTIDLSGPISFRVGVYLDHMAGTLSFYNVSDTMTLIHRVQTTFTQPLYPGFGFGFVSLVRGSSFELC